MVPWRLKGVAGEEGRHRAGAGRGGHLLDSRAGGMAGPCPGHIPPTTKQQQLEAACLSLGVKLSHRWCLLCRMLAPVFLGWLPYSLINRAYVLSTHCVSGMVIRALPLFPHLLLPTAQAQLNMDPAFRGEKWITSSLLKDSPSAVVAGCESRSLLPHALSISLKIHWATPSSNLCPVPQSVLFTCSLTISRIGQAPSCPFLRAGSTWAPLAL